MSQITSLEFKVKIIFFDSFLVAYYLDRCDRDDPQVNECLMNSANKLARYLQNGVPELGIEQVPIFTINN